MKASSPDETRKASKFTFFGNALKNIFEKFQNGAPTENFHNFSRSSPQTLKPCGINAARCAASFLSRFGPKIERRCAASSPLGSPLPFSAPFLLEGAQLTGCRRALAQCRGAYIRANRTVPIFSCRKETTILQSHFDSAKPPCGLPYATNGKCSPSPDLRRLQCTPGPAAWARSQMCKK